MLLIVSSTIVTGSRHLKCKYANVMFLIYRNLFFLRNCEISLLLSQTCLQSTGRFEYGWRETVASTGPVSITQCHVSSCAYFLCLITAFSSEGRDTVNTVNKSWKNVRKKLFFPNTQIKEPTLFVNSCFFTARPFITSCSL